MKNLMLILLLCSVSFTGATQGNKEDVQSMLIVSIMRYVEWEKVTGDFEVAVVGNPKIFENLSKFLINKKIQGVQVKVVQVGSKDNLTNVEVLVSTKHHLKQDNLLTVNLQNTTGIMNLVEEDGKIKMKIRKTLATENKLRLSSALTSIIQVID